MDTREILQIVLGIIIALVVILGGLMIYTLTREAETVIVEELSDENRTVRERRNPWADQGEAAIALVSRAAVKTEGEEGGPATIGALLEDEKFVQDKLKITSGKREGWNAQWWGETSYGPSFYLVRYAFLDENITIGPSWLVDLQTQKVVPKNVLAKVTQDPKEGVKSDYYDKANQVVAAIASHRFSGNINLGGALLRYFEERGSAGDEGDRVLGWTVDHDRDERFQVYFQWTAGGEATYASFEFDFDQKALRALNLQAHEIMRVGEEFEPLERVSIMPRTYDPKQPLASQRWQGAARQQCRQTRHQDRCKALATILDDERLIETLEWVLTVSGESSEEFRRCQQPEGSNPPPCRWNPREKEKDVFLISYQYDLGDKSQEISWEVHLKEEKVVPVDALSELAYRAVHPRG